MNTELKADLQDCLTRWKTAMELGEAHSKNIDEVIKNVMDLRSIETLETEKRLSDLVIVAVHSCINDLEKVFEMHA